MTIPDYVLYAAEQLGLDINEYGNVVDLLHDVQQIARDTSDYFGTIADRAQADALAVGQLALPPNADAPPSSSDGSR